MAAFNDANLDRPRYRIRGRVLVSTTSGEVEFLSLNLRESVPLWNVASQNSGNDYPAKHLLVFTFEGDGYLTFGDSRLPGHDFELKVLDVGPFTRFEYDPRLFNLVKVADPFRILITGSEGYRYNPEGRWVVTITYEDGSTRIYEIEPVNGGQLPESVWLQNFPIGSVWKGSVDNYPGFRNGRI